MFLAKTIYKLPTTRALIDHLRGDPVLRRICGWERKSWIPSESTFSRTFEEFAESGLAINLQAAFIEMYHKDHLVGHLSRDSTAIESREKALKKAKKSQTKDLKKRGRPKKGEERALKSPSRLERQETMNLLEMLADLPKACDIGTKKNSKGYTESWKGYKLHIDTIDGDIPVSFLLTSASLHDSQVALPLSTLSGQKIVSLYELMDAAYDADPIRKHVIAQGRIPLIDFNHRSSKDVRCFAPHEAERYKERSAAERVNSNLKDNFGGRFIRVKGHAKVLSHLAFGLLVMTIEQSLRLLNP